MKKLEDILEWYKRDVIELFGNDLVSIIVFGSASSHEYVHKKSDINTVVVLNDEGIADVWRAQKSIAKWSKKRIACPYFMTKAYIEASLDSFPVEFFNIRSTRHVLFGENVLKDIKVRNQDLRLECERDLKGKLLQLRRGVVMTGGSVSELKHLVRHSLSAFTSIFRALLFLRNEKVPEKKTGVLHAACEAFGLDAKLFKELYAVREGKEKIKRDDWIPVMKRYIAEIEKLCIIVDQMIVKK